MTIQYISYYAYSLYYFPRKRVLPLSNDGNLSNLSSLLFFLVSPLPSLWLLSFFFFFYELVQRIKKKKKLASKKVKENNFVMF